MYTETLRPITVQEIDDPFVFRLSANNRFLVASAGEWDVQIIDDPLNPSPLFERTLPFEPTWCSIDDHGKYLLYGEEASDARITFIEELASGETTELENVSNALITGNELWAVRKNQLQQLSLPDGEVLNEGEIPQPDPNFPQVPFLWETHRPGTIGLTHPANLLFYEAGAPQQVYPICRNLGHPPTYPYMAPHGGELILGQGDVLRKMHYPFVDVVAQQYFAGMNSAVGAYIDDVHFLTIGDDGYLHLVHTRSMERTRRFRVEGPNDSGMIFMLSMLNREYLLIHFTNPYRSIFRLSDFLKS